MNIRKRLTIQFISIVALIIFMASLAIYFFSADYRQNDFYSRLKNKATNVAKLLIEVDEVDASLLRKMEKDNPVSLPEEKIIIYNYKNEVLYSSDEDDVLKIAPEVLDEIRLENEIQFSQGKYEVLGFLYADKYDRFVVIAGAVDIFGINKLKNLRTILLIVFGSSIIVVFFSGWIYSGRALRPISRLIEQVNEITASNLDTRLERRNEQDEIAHLADTFNQMLDRLEIAFKLQKSFIANASHELRTPLTAITGQLEVVLLKERSSVEYRQVIASVLDDMKNLNLLSNRLLLLAQASAESQNLDPEAVRIDDVLWQVRSEIVKRTPAYHVNILFDPSIDDEDKLTLKGSEQLLKIAVSNLIENGCKYSKNSEINVMIRHDRHMLVLLFEDRGMGIAKDDIPHIFEPFYRGKNAFDQKGHGIGLSLVERIIKSHQGQINVASEINKGTIFTVNLPSKF